MSIYPLNLPPIMPKKIIEVTTQDQTQKQKFRFVHSDTKADIRDELAKEFNMDRFSLVDPDGNIITGTFDSLEDTKSYTIVDRTRMHMPVSSTFAETETTTQSVKREVEDEANPRQGKRVSFWGSKKRI